MQNNFQTSPVKAADIAKAAVAGETVTEAVGVEAEEADARYDLIFLDPKAVRLFRTGGPTSALRLALADPQVGGERSYLRVQIARAFPLRDPDRYIGLRDGADKDIGTLVTLDGLDDDSRRLAEEELFRRYFLPKVTKVRNVKDEFGMMTWDVETDKGPRTFIIRNLREASQEVSPTRLLLTDTDGNRYEFPDVRKLDEKSFAIIQRVL